MITPGEIIAGAIGVLAGVVLQSRQKRESVADRALRAELGPPPSRPHNFTPRDVRGIGVNESQGDPFPGVKAGDTITIGPC